MKRPGRLATLAGILFFLVPSAGPAAEMKMELKLDASNPRLLQTRFGMYGYHDRQTLFPEVDALRFYLPPGVAGITQTGVYSKFALAGDCEVLAAYELQTVTPPKSGYGSGVGLAFDVGEKGGRGDMQRVYRVGGESGYALHSGLKGKKDEDRFEPAVARWGRIGLRRVKKELIFLAAEEGGEIQEIARLPFTDQTIKSVRFFADPGGSPTAVDVWLRQIEMRAEQITGGVAAKDVRPSNRWLLWIVVPLAGVGLLFWFWRSRRRSSEEEEP